MVTGLTKRQREIYDFIRSYTAENGYPPSIREIGRNFAIRSTNGVNDHLKALERKGKISRGEFKSRALAVNKPDSLEFVDNLNGRLVEVPVLGAVPAGSPVLAEQAIEDRVYLDSFFVAPEQEVFALRVEGESMIEDGIYDGDYIFVRKQLEATRGAIVVVMVEKEATVKRFYKEPGHIRLQPANATMDPIIIPDDEFTQTMILGAVVGVFRKM